jgi:tetratricopeptide (TPR) repeat protein
MEASALATKTHTHLLQLTATLKDVVTRQDRYDRGLNLNSFIAYLLFTLLLGGGFYLMYQARAGNLVAERDAALKGRGESAQQAAAARTELTLRDAGEKKAAELWGLYKDGRRADFITRYPELTGVKLTPVEAQVLEEDLAKARAEIADASFAAGTEAVRGEQWKKAAAELKKALAYEPEGPRATTARYQLGVALFRMGEADEATAQLEKALAGGVEKGVIEARFFLAAALEAAKQPDRARQEYTKFADDHFQHPLAGAARRRAAALVQATRGSSPGTGPR